MRWWSQWSFACRQRRIDASLLELVASGAASEHARIAASRGLLATNAAALDAKSLPAATEALPSSADGAPAAETAGPSAVDVEVRPRLPCKHMHSALTHTRGQPWDCIVNTRDCRRTSLPISSSCFRCSSPRRCSKVTRARQGLCRRAAARLRCAVMAARRAPTMTQRQLRHPCPASDHWLRGS